MTTLRTIKKHIDEGRNPVAEEGIPVKLYQLGYISGPLSAPYITEQGLKELEHHEY